MKRFAALFREMDETTRTTEKVDAMVRYFADAEPDDAAWAVWFLTGNRFRRLLPVRLLADWAMEEADAPSWLFEECHATVGDLAETIALLLPDGRTNGHRSLHEWAEALRQMPRMSEPDQRQLVLDAWRSLGTSERFVWNKLVTGGWRVGVSKQLVVRALATFSGVDEGTVAHRLTGNWDPNGDAFRALVARDTSDADRTRPYPFYLAYALEGDIESLGDVSDWQVEWKWDGIRSQLIRRDGSTWIWSRGEELVTDRFPELLDWSRFLPDGVVIDGEILPWKDGAPLPFAHLQRRIGRPSPGPKILAEVPVTLLAYDLLEHDGTDVREQPLATRRDMLTRVLTPPMRLSPVVQASSWDDVRRAHANARSQGAEGLMLKRRDGAYGVGRRKGGWWKWKVQPLTVDAVMIYAQAGHGRRATLHTDYTFGVWHEGTLIPFAKAYSGLTDDELRTLDGWIRRHTLEKFGPVRRVDPVHVFEVAFEGIQRSTRHKAGVAVRFPRILRWRTDKKAEDADSLDTLLKLIDAAP